MRKWLLGFVIAAAPASCTDTGSRPADRDTPAFWAAEFEDAPGLEVAEEVDHFGYREQVQRRIADGAREGRYLRFNQEGQRLEEGFYKNDTLHGPRVLYYPGGDTLSIERYDMGSFEGEFRQYYENGRLHLAGLYADNQMTGKWRQYYDTGELMEVVTFQANAENGPFIEYYRNGNLKAEGNYLDGDNEQGLLKIYDEQGTLIRKMNCEKGVCRTIWKREE